MRLVIDMTCGAWQMTMDERVPCLELTLLH